METLFDLAKRASVQRRQDLEHELAFSDSLYNIVYFHNPAFNSKGSKGRMQWPFEDWGATAVLMGHRHNYERVMRDDNGDGVMLPYITSGLGGRSISSFGSSSVAGSVAQYDGNYGTLLVQASDVSITFEFLSIDGGGTIVDSYTIDLPAPMP